MVNGLCCVLYPKYISARFPTKLESLLVAADEWHLTSVPHKMKKVMFATVLWLVCLALFQIYDIIRAALTNQVFLHRFGFWQILSEDMFASFANETAILLWLCFASLDKAFVEVPVLHLQVLLSL